MKLYGWNPIDSNRIIPNQVISNPVQSNQSNQIAKTQSKCKILFKTHSQNPNAQFFLNNPSNNYQTPHMFRQLFFFKWVTCDAPSRRWHFIVQTWGQIVEGRENPFDQGLETSARVLKTVATNVVLADLGLPAWPFLCLNLRLQEKKNIRTKAGPYC